MQSMKVRDELRKSFAHLGVEGVRRRLFDGFSLPEEAISSVMGSLLAGHHILLCGPPGVGKTSLARRFVTLLEDREVVASCPVNCAIDQPACPWCLRMLERRDALVKRTLPGYARMVKVSGSAGLTLADLLGDLDPQSALEHGIMDPRAFVPGKLLRANGSILLIDFIDRIPERVLNGVLACLAHERMDLGVRDYVFPVDFLIVATATASIGALMPVDLADYFDIVSMAGVATEAFEERLVSGGLPSSALYASAIEVVRRTRSHEDLARGVSVRGAIRYGELLRSYQKVVCVETPGELLPPASRVALPHRVEVAPHAVETRTGRSIIEEIVQDVLGASAAAVKPFVLPKETMYAIVEEIARLDHFRKPLKFGLFDLLLKRIKRFPDSELARLYSRVLDEMARRYREHGVEETLTFDLLTDIEEARLRQERLSAEVRARLEAEAVVRTVAALEESKILSARNRGYTLSQRGVALLLERLAPRLWEKAPVIGQGKHRTGKKVPIGDGRVVGTRSWWFGDRYRDIALKETMRQALRNRHKEIMREDIQVLKRDVRARMDTILCLDLSGTMKQLDKLWYAKESAIALSLASSGYKDRVGLVTFSNLASVVSDLTLNTYRLTEKVLDLDLHENAFTNLGYALATARALFARHSSSHGKQHIILVSDGDATAPHPAPARYATREAARCRRRGITISCICINEENADPHLMQRIARIGGGRVALIEDTRSLRGSVVAEMRAAASR